MGLEDSSEVACDVPGAVHPVAAKAFGLLRERYERPLMSNVDRGGFVECMVRTLLGNRWELMWALGDDWAPWDIVHPTGPKIEIKQSAARQAWHPGEMPKARASRFDIRPRQQYSPEQRRWTGKPVRAAHLYICCWHPEARKHVADHRNPEQWEFIVVPTERLPIEQKTIGLHSLRGLGESVQSNALASTVERMLDGLGHDTSVGY